MFPTRGIYFRLRHPMSPTSSGSRGSLLGWSTGQTHQLKNSTAVSSPLGSLLQNAGETYVSFILRAIDAPQR